MPRQRDLGLLLLAALQATAIFGQPPVTRLNPAVSEQDSATHGIGAAQTWIFDEFKSYSA
jgi:hypothetical protein